jgi:luciferase-like monooxygenase
MDIGIGLPNTLDVAGPVMAEWARRAEERGFACLATIDRIVYPSYDSLTALAVAAGATSRIGLFPDILLAPLYPPVWLAKATASLAAMSGGRLTLGLSVGNRPDDFAAMDRPVNQRGRLMDQTLDLLTRAWAGESVTGDDLPVAPIPPGNRIPMLIGGNADASIRRVVAYGDGEPRIAALVYFGLGDPDASKASLLAYYRFLGDWAEAIAGSAVRTPQGAKEIARAFAGVGVTDLVFDPTVASIDEVDRLADAVL